MEKLNLEVEYRGKITSEKPFIKRLHWEEDF